MKISYKAKYDLSKPAVVKLWFGEKYLVLKLLNFKDDVNALAAAVMENQAAGGDLKPYATARVKKAMKALDPKKGKAEIEIMLASNRGEDLLAREQALLNQADKACLNTNKTALYSKWVYDFISPKENGDGFFRLKGRHAAVPCVVKLWVGKKFFIWKCMDIQEFEWKFNESHAANMRKYNPRSNDRMNPLVRYIRQTGIEHGTIEVIYKANLRNPGWLAEYLAAEKKFLKENIRKAACLNVTVKKYRAKWIKELHANQPI